LGLFCLGEVLNNQREDGAVEVAEQLTGDIKMRRVVFNA